MSNKVLESDESMRQFLEHAESGEPLRDFYDESEIAEALATLIYKVLDERR